MQNEEKLEKLQLCKKKSLYFNQLDFHRLARFCRVRMNESEHAIQAHTTRNATNRVDADVCSGELAPTPAYPQERPSRS